MISSDSTILDAGAVQNRIASYGAILDELVVIVFQRGVKRDVRIAKNVVVHLPGGYSKFAVLLSGVRLLTRFVKRKECDVISVQDPFILGFLGLVFSWVRRIPLQVQVHTDCFSPLFISESFRRRMESVLARFVVRHASCIRVVSERVRKSVALVSNASIHVLPILIADTSLRESIRPNEFKDRFTLLTVSRLTKEKQLYLLLDSLRGVHDVDCIIVGDGPLRTSLEHRVNSLGLEERVRFAGRQSDVSAYYQHADCYINVSRYEGYGMALMEAARYGLPIITTDVGIVGDVLRDEKEVLVVEADASAVGRGISRVIAESSLLDRLGVNARMRAEETLMPEDEYLKRYQQALMTCV